MSSYNYHIYDIILLIVRGVFYQFYLYTYLTVKVIKQFKKIFGFKKNYFILLNSLILNKKTDCKNSKIYNQLYFLFNFYNRNPKLHLIVITFHIAFTIKFKIRSTRMFIAMFWKKYLHYIFPPFMDTVWNFSFKFNNRIFCLWNFHSI